MHAAACSGGLLGLRAPLYSLVFSNVMVFFAAPRLYRFRTGGCFHIFLAATAVREVCVCEGGVGGEGWAGRQVELLVIACTEVCRLGDSASTAAP